MADKEVTKKQTRKTPVKAGTLGRQKEKKEVVYIGKERDTEERRKITQEEEEPSLLKDILSISGYTGLYRYISQARNGMIVEALGTGKRMNAFATMKVNSLKDIAVYTREKEVTLEEVFRKIFEKENGGSALDSKSEPDKLVAYFSEVLPDYSEEKVYVSDIRKVLSWYNILHGLKLLNFENGKVPKNESQPVKKKKTETKKES